jgi:dipeptidase E
MKMLLTSGGIKNQSIHDALVGLLPIPIHECNALCITTASYGLPETFSPQLAYQFITDTANMPMINLGWKSVGVLELSALPSLGENRWLPLVQETDVFLVNGGDTMYLSHWMKESGLAATLSELDAVWVGLSAGSVVMAPRIGRNFVHWPEEAADDEALGMVDFAIFPHLDYPDLPTHSMAHAELWAATLNTPGYAIDEDTTITVVDGDVQVVSEGNWHLFAKP